MVVDLPIFSKYVRPRFNVYLNGKVINIILDTGARSVIFTGSKNYLEEYKLKTTDVKRGIGGFGGSGNLCDTYLGNIVLSSKGRIIKYEDVEIVHSPLRKYEGFYMVLPMVLFKDFDICIFSGLDRHIRIDTKRNDKVTYHPKYNNIGATVDILYQEESNPLGLLTSLPDII